MESSVVVELRARVEATLRDCVLPGLSLDSTDIEVLDVADGVVRIRVGRDCAECPATTMTLIFGMERELRKRIAEIEYIEAVA
jgi:Fe-S cluster biogenesis protein NfuA